MCADKPRTVDPLGEIKRRAEELWRDAGKPADKTWEDFIAAAEDELLGGRSHGETSGRLRQEHHRNFQQQTTLAPELVPFVEQESNPLLSILASAIKQPLTDHECLCLTRLLNGAELRLRDKPNIGDIDLEQLATIFSHLAAEYDEQFLRKMGCASAAALSVEKRAEYWKDRMQQLIESDEALTYADRNTMSRISTAIVAEERVAELIHKG